MAAPGTVWENDTWDDDAWEDNTWADIVPPIPSGSGNLSPGSSYVLGQDVIYTLPAKTVRIAVFTVAGTIETSEDGITWQAITLNVNNEFNTAAKFIHSIDDDSTVSVKVIKRNLVG